MAITQDGSQKFGVTSTYGSFVIESLSRNHPSAEVILPDQQGAPAGVATIPKRVEINATVQVGEGSVPAIGSEVTIVNEGYASEVFILTDVTLNETQADYQRFTITGFKKDN